MWATSTGSATPAGTGLVVVARTLPWREVHFDRHFRTVMRTNESRSSTSSSTRGATTPADRRRRTRLRDLCDEVLASYRMARQADPFTDQDRAQGRAIFSSIVRASR